MKINSRKFIVWVAWFVLVVANMIITKDVNSTLVWAFVVVSGIYIGGNVLQKLGLNKLEALK